MPVYMQHHEFAMPTPAHAQTDGARSAVEVMIAQGHARRIARDNASMVTVHGRPPVEPYVREVLVEAPYTRIKITKKGRVKELYTDFSLQPTGQYVSIDPVTASARRMLRDAEAAGWRTNLITLADRCAVEGVRGTCAFRVIWVRGKAAGARWHERDERYEWHTDERPVGVNKLTYTALERHRGAGMSRVRLRLVAGPRGVPIPMAELTKRIKETAS